MGIRRAAFFAGLCLYAAWTFATWFLEGRVLTLLRPDAAVDRVVYALVGNLLLGIVAGLAVLAYVVRAGALEPASAGLGTPARTLVASAVGLGLGFAMFASQSPPTLDPMVILNAFSQVLVVSAAEVVVCWCVVGSTAEALLGKGRWGTTVAAIVAAALFGLYHFAHSPPFNTWSMVGFLTLIGLVTGAFYFLSRDLVGTVLFHNFLGTLGVLQALAKAGTLSAFERLQPALVGTALVTLATLVALQGVVRLQPAAATRRRAAA